jgi:hypothetical protein
MTLDPGVTDVLTVGGAVFGAYLGVRLALVRVETKHQALERRVDDHDKDIGRIDGQLQGASRKIAEVAGEVNVLRRGR